MRTNTYIDDNLMAQAIRISGLTTPKEIVNLALQEFVEKRKRKNLAQLKGRIEFADGYDYKKLRCGE